MTASASPLPPAPASAPAPSPSTTTAPESDATPQALEAAAPPRDLEAEAVTAHTRLSRALLIATLTLCVATLLIRVLARFDIRQLWDDAYMFQRYARNLLDGHGVAWNPGGEPTYGLTSPLFLIVGVPLHALTRGNHGLAAVLSSALCGVAFIVLFGVLLLRRPRAQRPVAQGIAVVIAFCFALSSLAAHFTSGMDTMFAMSFAALAILLAQRAQERPTTRRSVAVGAVLAFAFWVRPDLTLLALAIPLASFLFAKTPEARRGALISLALAGGGLALVLGVNLLYFKSLLPLPFYGKSAGIYGDTIERAYAGSSTQELLNFLESFWPLLLVITIDIALSRRQFFRRATPLHLATLTSALVGMGYYWLLALPIMGMSQRFYFAALPGLAYAAACSARRIIEGLTPQDEPDAPKDARPLPALSPRAATLFIAGGLALLWFECVPVSSASAKELASAAVQRRIMMFNMDKNLRRGGAEKYWYAIADFSALPDDLLIATTEVGVPAAANPRKRIIDMAGLNDREFAHSPFDAARFFARESPDLIYMPHPDYRPMVQSLLSDPHFQGYEVFSHRELGTTRFGVALRRSSKHYDAMRAVLGKKRPTTSLKPDDL